MNFKICSRCSRVKQISIRKNNNECCFSCYNLKNSDERFNLRISILEFYEIKSHINSISIDAIIQHDFVAKDFSKNVDIFQRICGYRGCDGEVSGECPYLTEHLFSEFNERKYL